MKAEEMFTGKYSPPPTSLTNSVWYYKVLFKMIGKVQLHDDDADVAHWIMTQINVANPNTIWPEPAP